MKGFDVVDVTHKPKRTQADNIKKAGTAYADFSQLQDQTSTSFLVINDTGVSVQTGVSVRAGSVIPKNITLETAITFFRRNAKGELASLFTQTAEWLDKYRVASKTAMKKLIDEAKADSKSDVLTVDMSEVE